MNRGNFSIDPDEEMKRNCCGTLGRGFDDFSRKDLRDIILDKNKVIADLEEHAYGSASWIENLNKGLKKANELKKNAPPKESDEDFRKRLEAFDKGSAPTEAWGADELDGDGFFGDIFKQADKEGKEKWDKLSPEEKVRAEIRQNVRVHQGQAGFFNKRHYEKLAKLEADYESNLARRIADAKEMGQPVNESAISALRASRKRAAEDFAKEMAALGGGVVVSKEPSREPPREPPKEPPLVRADGSNAAEITAGALTPEQKIIIQTALEYANARALDATGWQDRMYPDELNRWVAVFRQNVSPQLLPVVDENMALIRQLANMRPDLRANYIESIVDEIGRSLNRAISSSGKKPDAVYKQIEKRKGGAAVPTPTEPKVSPVAAAAAALQPVRTAIQNGIGDAIYGKEDDPKKQRKGLLGISEEGKEESKKKVMKNIVVPIVKTATALGKSIKDTANRIFNPSQYDADMKDERIKRIKRAEAEAGIVRDKENPSIIIRKPRGYWDAETTDPTEEAYNTKRLAHINRGAKTQEERDKEVFYIRVPNPIFAAKLRPSFQELAKAGFVKQVGNDKQLNLWTGVQQLDPKVKEDVDGTLERLHDDEFIWLPEDRAKEIYGKLRQFVADKQDEGVAEGFEDLGWSKGEMKEFAKIDPRTLTGQDLIDWKQEKLLIDRTVTENALKKVTKDIAEEEKKATPDQARLAKMREGKVRVEKREKELILRGQQEFKDMMMFQGAEKAKRDAEYYAKQERDGQEIMDEANAAMAAWAAKPVAEKIAILEKALADPQNNQMEIADYTEQIEQLRAEEASEKAEEQAQGSVDLLQQAEVIGAEGGADSESDEEMEGAGAMEYILQKAGMPIFNPSGDTTKAGRQSFTPDYDAYGDDEEQGRLNAFNLSASMYNQSKAIDLPDFKLVKDDTSIRFYRKDDDDVILVGIRGTDFQSWTDFYTWFVIGGRGDLRLTTRFMDDLAKLVAFQRNYPPSQFYYVATGHSLAGSIIDRFLEMGLIEEAITYNPSIEKRHLLDENILNHRVYLDTDPLFILMGQYSPNTEIRVNPNKTNFYNPSKEKDYLIKSHLIYPVSNPALEGGGMEGSGKTYTLEEWKAIFDAKLEQKRKAIEAREAKKKQTAKAKRERAKARRDEREKPKEPEPEPELEVTQFTIDGQIILVEDDDAGEKRFLDRRVFNDDSEEIGTLGSLTPEKLRKLVVERVQRREKRGEFAPEVVFSEDEEDDDDDEPPPLEAPFRTSRVQKATPPKGEPKKRKPRFKIVAPASARVELREELVAEQPRTEQGKFAEEAETAVVAVSEAPQRAYMKLMKSPIFTDAERKLLTRIRETKMTPRMRAVLLGRSGLARKVMEMMGLDESAFQSQRSRARIADTTEKRVATKKATEILFPHLPEATKTGLQKLAQAIMNRTSRRPTMKDDRLAEDDKKTETVKMTLTEKRQMLRRNFVAGVMSCEAIVSMTRTDMFGDYSCRNWEKGDASSYFKRVETDYGAKGRCMAIGDESANAIGQQLDKLKPVEGVGRDNAMLSSFMLAGRFPSTWGNANDVWRNCIHRMFASCGVDNLSIGVPLAGRWKRGSGILIEWGEYLGDTGTNKLTKAKIAEAQRQMDEKLSSPKLRDFLVDLRGFCEMTAEAVEPEDEKEVAQRAKDAEEKAYLRRVASEMNPDEEEERARISANPELRSRLRSAIQRDEAVMRRHGMMNATYSGSVIRLNHFKRLAGIDYNAGYGAVAPFNLSASQKAKLPERKKKDYQSVEEYIKFQTPDDRDTGVNR